MKFEILAIALSVMTFGLNVAHADEENADEKVKIISVNVRGSQNTTSTSTIDNVGLTSDESNKKQYSGGVDFSFSSDKIKARDSVRNVVGAHYGSDGTRGFNARSWTAPYSADSEGDFGAALSLDLGEKSRLAEVPFSLAGYLCSGGAGPKHKVIICPFGFGATWERHTLDDVKARNVGSFNVMAELTTKHLDLFLKGSMMLLTEDQRIQGEAGIAGKLNKNVAVTVGGTAEKVDIVSGKDTINEVTRTATDYGVNAGVKVSF